MRPVGAVGVCSPAMALIAISSCSYRFCRGAQKSVYTPIWPGRLKLSRVRPVIAGSCRLARRGGFEGKVGRRNLVQQGAQTNCSLIAEGSRKLSLRILPALEPGPQSFEAGVRQSQLLAATVRAARLDADKAVA